MRELTCGKSSQTVKSRVMELLGLLAEFFPEHIVDKSNQILPIFKETLFKQFRAQKPDMQVFFISKIIVTVKTISGAITGLSHFLVKFSGDFASGNICCMGNLTQKIKKIFRPCISMFVSLLSHHPI